jgi:hypothetical protein
MTVDEYMKLSDFERHVHNLVHCSVDDLKSSLNCTFPRYNEKTFLILDEAFARMNRAGQRTKCKLLASYMSRLLKQKRQSL